MNMFTMSFVNSTLFITLWVVLQRFYAFLHAFIGGSFAGALELDFAKIFALPFSLVAGLEACPDRSGFRHVWR